jgi:hypothetical protein
VCVCVRVCVCVCVQGKLSTLTSSLAPTADPRCVVCDVICSLLYVVCTM